MPERLPLLSSLKFLMLRLGWMAWGIFIISKSAEAQYFDTHREPLGLGKDIATFFHLSLESEKKILVSPVHWDDHDWMTLALLVSGGGMVMGYDREIFNHFQNNRSATGDKVARYFAEPMGSGVISVPLLAAIYVGGRLGGNHRLAGAAMAGASAFMVTAINVQVMKSLVGRERPTITDDPYIFHGPSLRHDALPSGHTAVAFAMAAAISTYYDDHPWLTAGLLTIAALTGWSRINDGKHWPSDVIAGAVIGYYMGRWVGRQWKTNKAGKSESDISLQPIITPQAAGLRLAWNLK